MATIGWKLSGVYPVWARTEHSWKSVPLRLAIGSRLRYALPVIHREERWPPWHTDACGVEDGRVVVRLQDAAVMFELPLQPTCEDARG